NNIRHRKERQEVSGESNMFIRAESSKTKEKNKEKEYTEGDRKKKTKIYLERKVEKLCSRYIEELKASLVQEIISQIEQKENLLHSTKQKLDSRNVYLNRNKGSIDDLLELKVGTYNINGVKNNSYRLQELVDFGTSEKFKLLEKDKKKGSGVGALIDKKWAAHITKEQLLKYRPSYNLNYRVLVLAKELELEVPESNFTKEWCLEEDTDQLYDTHSKTMLTWRQVKSLRGESMKRRKAVENQLALLPKLKRISEKKSKNEWILYKNKKSQELNIGRIKRKTETKAKIEVWASGDKENLELKFESEKKRRKTNSEEKQIKEVTQEKRAPQTFL
ncbi:12628_t:CDS:2, partial [Gigaspora rosea]